MDQATHDHIRAAWQRDLQDMNSWPFVVPYGLTEGQAMCLSFIRNFITEHGHAPSFNEIAKGIGQASKSGVARLLDALKERGHIRMKPHSARSIQVVRAA